MAQPERIECFGVRLQVRRLLQSLGRFGLMSQLGKKGSEVDIGQEERGSQSDRRPIFRDRLFMLSQRPIGVSQIVVRFHETGIEFYGSFQNLDRFSVFAEIHQRGGEIAQRACIARVELRRPVVRQDGVFWFTQGP